MYVNPGNPTNVYLFITSISIHYNKWMITLRFNHHAMKIYKSYYIARRKNTNIIFFIIIIFFTIKTFYVFVAMKKIFLFLYYQKNLSKFLATIFCTHVYQDVCEIRLEQLFLNLFVPFSCKLGSSFNDILPTFCVIGAFATFLSNFKS